MAQSKWVWEEHTRQLVLSGSRKGFRQKCAQTKLSSPGLQPLPIMPQDRPHPDRKVTLEDIKVVAISLLNEKSVLSVTKSVSKLFDQCYRTDQMNGLLWTSLLYYDAFLKHKVASSNENLSISGVMGDNARQELGKVEKELDKTQANLGQAYSLFILGLENWNIHHSKGGRSRMSRTHTDQMFFEILYEFVMLCTWICFSYEHWEIVHAQLGKFFRTSAFNRDCKIDGESLVVEGLGSISKKSDEYLAYRVHYDRPPVGSLKSLQSPAIMKFMSPATRKPEDSFPKERKQLGIIGDKLSHYNPQTLCLLETVQEDTSSDTSSSDGDTSSDGDSDCSNDHEDSVT